MAITALQVQQIKDAHTAGMLDPAIAQHAGVSLATVKRYRDRLGLTTHCVTAQRGKLGEQLVAAEAARRGLTVDWHARERDGHDLLISGQRVDAKAAMQLTDGLWRFRMHRMRESLFGQYAYRKNYAEDCEVIALVALYPDETPPDFYLLSSLTLPEDIRIRRGGPFEPAREDWGLLAPTATIQA
ncbi:hypothetical protein [Deinococcus sp. AJ005]|uniref:hypothetical protein n=1 Tax=Deinococcus sp. AJ005 TaxID=2652443 RepID=UPI00125CA979|nr:hypothetical protein [Deinococcus sp. AJ005]QFP77467.1 hypothetical protein DAAJ005_14100 [Deinococcus sp. AJ005]